VLRRCLALLAVGLVMLGITAGDACAHETDQFTLPMDRPFADMGDFLDAVHYRALEKGAAKINARIVEAMKDPDPVRRRQRIDELHDPWRISEAVYGRFNDAFFEIVDLELALRSDWARQSHPGEITAYTTLDWIYSVVHFPLDPRRIVLLFQSSTFKAYGVYFGTDKLSHFHHLGAMYYGALLGGRSMGLSEEEALARVLETYVEGPVSEWALLGFAATGVHSNADLAANYAGMKFYQNLTEPVRLKGQMRPPLLVIHNELYRLNKHVRPESGWFGAFVSDHWNEALNPSLFDPTIRARVNGVLRQRAERIVEFYTRVDGRPADPAYFERYARSLATLDGESYGHSGEWENLYTIGNTCWPIYAQRNGITVAPVARADQREPGDSVPELFTAAGAPPAPPR
jgi:hypothetical protein